MLGPRPTAESVVSSFDAAFKAMCDGRVLAELRPPAGVYALVFHQSAAKERTSDLKYVYQRMVRNESVLARLCRKELKLRPPGSAWPDEDSDALRALREIDRRRAPVLHCLRLDFELLYVFGAICLDQWAYVAAYLAGLPEPERVAFHRLARLVEAPNALPAALQTVAGEWRPSIRWLHFQMRTCRNRFVEHADRPWQRGITFGANGLDFRLEMPSPVGWIDEEKSSEAARALLRLAPKWLQHAPDGYWEKARPRALLSRVIENIGAVDHQCDRDEVAAVAGLIGLATPSFHEVAGRLAFFLSGATPVLIESALANAGAINLGQPWKNHLEVTKDFLAQQRAAGTSGAAMPGESPPSEDPAPP